MSFYNWETQTSTSNATPNFQVIADNEAGLLFKNKRDRKVINVDPAARAGDNSTRTELETDEYTQGTTTPPSFRRPSQPWRITFEVPDIAHVYRARCTLLGPINCTDLRSA